MRLLQSSRLEGILKGISAYFLFFSMKKKKIIYIYIYIILEVKPFTQV